MQQPTAVIAFADRGIYSTPPIKFTIHDETSDPIRKDNLKLDHPKPLLSQETLRNVSCVIDPEAEEDKAEATPSELAEAAPSGLAREEWPQIWSIVRKISALEGQLTSERRINLTLNKQINQFKDQLQRYQLEIEEYSRQIGTQKQSIEELGSQIQQLQIKIQEQQQEIKEEKGTISDLQIQQMKRGVEFQARVTKMNSEQKELNVRIRKVNAELEGERKNNIQMKKEMVTKIEELQSNKENYLLEEIERLKGTIEEDRGEREGGLLQENTQLRGRIFQLEEGLKVAGIKLNLADRKKQQAISEAVDKKEQEMKVQKLLTKSLHQKIARLQEEGRGKKKTEISPRLNRSIQVRASRPSQEQICFQLSP